MKFLKRLFCFHLWCVSRRDVLEDGKLPRVNYKDWISYRDLRKGKTWWGRVSCVRCGKIKRFSYLFVPIRYEWEFQSLKKLIKDMS